MRAFTVAVLLVVANCLPAQPPDAKKLPLPVKDLVAALIESFKDLDSEVRLNSANALAAVGAPAVDPLIAVLGDPKIEVRSSAAYALGVMGADAVPSVVALVTLLKDPETSVRRQSTQALSRILLSQRSPASVLLPIIVPPSPPPPRPVFPEARP